MKAYAAARSWGSMLEHWSREHVQPERRRAHRLAASGLRLPADLPRRKRQPGCIWGVCIVRDEADIIELVIRHQLDQGIDVVLVADNGSVDGTRELLHDLARSHPVFVADDGWPVWDQAAKTDVLVQVARRAGADWVVPFDADELWFAEHGSVGQYLRSVPASLVHARMHNAFPLLDAAPDTDLRLRFDLSPHDLRKVAFRTHRLASVVQGNHHAHRWGPRSDGLRIAHVPWRSFDQMRRKVTQGSAAVQAAGLAPFHWTALSALDEEALRGRWRKILSGLPAADTCWSPQGPFAESAVLSWATWDPEGLLLPEQDAGPRSEAARG